MVPVPNAGATAGPSPLTVAPLHLYVNAGGGSDTSGSPPRRGLRPSISQLPFHLQVPDPQRSCAHV